MTDQKILNSTAKQREMKKLDELASDDNRQLLIIRTLFPFTIFPTTVTVDLNHVVVSTQVFFFSKQVLSFLIKDLLTVIVETNIFFATLKFVDRFFPQDTVPVRFLSKPDADKAFRVINGLIIAERQNVNLTALPSEEVMRKVEEIGQTGAAPP